MSTRRDLLVALGAGLAWPRAVFAQAPSGKVPRIGFLGVPAAAGMERHVASMRDGLKEHGYVEGRNIAIEWRWSGSDRQRLAEMAAELVRMKVDIIVTHATPGTRAAMNATKTIPIIMALNGDPVAMGAVASLARPGGNVTGSSFFHAELATKRLDLLKQLFPRTRQVGVLVNPDNASHPVFVKEIEPTAQALKLELQTFGARNGAELERAIAAMAAARVDAALVFEDPVFISGAKAVATLLAKHRLRSIGFNEIAEHGGLLGYGVNLAAMWRNVGWFVDRILKGANPAEIPIERATKFEMVINRGAAKALGIRFPQSVLQRADRVIE